jgi:hypothetical protein
MIRCEHKDQYVFVVNRGSTAVSGQCECKECGSRRVFIGYHRPNDSDGADAETAVSKGAHYSGDFYPILYSKGGERSIKFTPQQFGYKQE